MGADVETGGGAHGAVFPTRQLQRHAPSWASSASQDSRIELSFSRFLDDGLVPSNANGLAGPGNPVVDRAAQVDSFRLTWDYAPAGSDLIDLSVLFYAERLGITETRVDTPRLDDTTYDTTGLEITNRSSLSLGVPVDLVYGIEILRDTQQGLRNGAPRPAFPDAEATTIAGFVEGTFALGPQFDLIAGLRYDRYDRDPDDPALSSVTNEFLSPRLGLSYRPTEDWQVYANLSRAFRAPSLTELYNSGLHFPGNPFGFPPNNFFVPNPNLRPEASTQVEIGARLDRAGQWRDGDRLSFAASAYYADATDYIDQTVSIAGGTTTFVNVDARLWGFEAEVDYDAGDWFVGAGLGIARGQSSDGFALGSLPQDGLTLTAGFRPTQDWELGARATLAAEQDRLPAGGTAGPGYELLDLFATFAPDRGALAGSTIRIGLDNVFDESYTIYPNGLPQTGRSLQITASFTF